jgi:predicted esterase
MRILLLPLLVAACGSPPSSSSADGPDGGTPPPPTPGTDAPVQAATTPAIPLPTGTCPTIASGDVTFAPAGMPPRKVKLALDPAKIGSGPLILYWYATGSSTVESGYALGATEQAITGAGGIVATPYADATAGTFEWFIVNQSAKQDDFLLADEIVGCLAQAHAIDVTHIHAMGMSAGALQTTALSFIRASYIASVATYSGGVPPGFTPANEDPANKFAALIFDGGTSDDVFSVDFKAASEMYKSMLDADGHFTAICDHGKGHAIPLDAAPSVAMFFAANGFGAWPSPYAAAGLPSSFPSYCTR